MIPTAPEKPPLLVVDSVQADPQNARRLSAEIRLGGYPLRVVLDFSLRSTGLTEYVDLPWMLGLHPPSQRAVVGLMDRVYSGESIPFPVDLSSQLIHSDPPSPFSQDPDTLARLDHDASKVTVEVLQLHHTGSIPAFFTADLRIDGSLYNFEVEFYSGLARVPVMRWLRGPHSLSQPQVHAIQRLFLGELEKGE